MCARDQLDFVVLRRIGRIDSFRALVWAYKKCETLGDVVSWDRQASSLAIFCVINQSLANVTNAVECPLKTSLLTLKMVTMGDQTLRCEVY
jgi:hypothetical protein